MNRAFVEAEGPPPEEPTLDPGTRFGRYEVTRLLGSGGFGHVYEATHRELGKAVALKVLRREFALHPTVRARFTREGQAASRLRHPNVVDVTDVGVCDGQPYLVMELLEGETLRARLARDGAMSPDRAVDLLLPVLDAIAEAHDRGVVHRDLKPENVFLARSGHRAVVPKVLDFGVVKLDADPRAALLTGSGVLLGTPSYMSPEQARDVRDLDGRSDQFALGAILHECLAGRRAFEADGVLDTLQRVANDEPAPLRADLPEGLRAAVARALRKKPVERFPSARAFAAALLPYASEAVRAQWSPPRLEDADAPPVAIAQVASGPRTVERHARADRRVWLALLVALVALAAGASLVLARPHGPAPPVAIARPATARPAPATAPTTAPPPPPLVAPPPAAPATAPAAASTTVVAPPPRAAPRPPRRALVAAPDAGPRAPRLGANGAVIED